jgi:hypothetical protein
MNKVSPGFVFGIVASIIIGFGIIAAVALGLNADTGLGYETSMYQASKIGPGQAELDLATYPDSAVCHADAPSPQITWVSYCPLTSLEVPPNTLVTVVIKQYDSASGLYNGFFGQVQGTIGGSATYNGKTETQIAAENIAHTFTLQSKPFETNPLYVSVPLLGVDSNAPNQANGYPTPNIVEFQFRTGASGTYVWHCYVPCGNDRETPYGFSGPMSTTGFMAGTLTVANY